MASEKDIGKAEAYVSRINDYPTASGAAAALAAQFAAVRAEERAKERAAIVAWLRTRGSPVVSLIALAIEEGEHEEGS